MRTVALMQPYFFPYAGYYRLFAWADHVIVYDTVQMPKGGRVHRTLVPGPSGEPEWLTLPVARHPLDTLVRDCRFAPDARAIFAKRLARYGWLRDARGPASQRLRAYLDAPHGSIADYVTDGIRIVADELRLPATIARSSESGLDPTLRGQDAVIAAVTAAGGTRYVNSPGGRALYDPEAFRKAGIELVFLPDYDGPYTMMLPALLAEDPATIAADILSVPAA